MPFLTSFQDTGDLPGVEFWRHLRTLAEFDSGRRQGRDSIDPEPALEYFGYRFVVESVGREPYDAEYVTGHFEVDERGMGARPEWVKINRAAIGHLVVAAAVASRAAMRQIRAAAGSDSPSATLEREQLLVTLEIAQRELTDAPYVNKNALRGIVAWLKKVADAKANGHSASLDRALRSAGDKLDELVKNLTGGNVRLPW